jgi:hypothetical protein
MRFSPLAEITPANAGNLARAWEFRTGDLDRRGLPDRCGHAPSTGPGPVLGQGDPVDARDRAGGRRGLALAPCPTANRVTRHCRIRTRRYVAKLRLRLGVAPPQYAREDRKHGDDTDRNQNRIEGHCSILRKKNAKDWLSAPGLFIDLDQCTGATATRRAGRDARDD